MPMGKVVVGWKLINHLQNLKEFGNLSRLEKDNWAASINNSFFRFNLIFIKIKYVSWNILLSKEGYKEQPIFLSVFNG